MTVLYRNGYFYLATNLLLLYRWGIKISNISKGHCAGCSGDREVGTVSCGWLASTVVGTHNGLDR